MAHLNFDESLLIRSSAAVTWLRLGIKDRPQFSNAAASRIVLLMFYVTDGRSRPMTLANMRAIGIRTLSVLCRCGREREVEVDCFNGALVVIRMHQHFRCGECGQRPQSVRPGPMGRNAIGGGSGHWPGERDPLYRPGDEALLML
ncbi:hypothetical protein ASE72_02105 [Sphingomonas sp. Leaf20]|nr:hypothetical protein ASE72_02105 [Sphingomonas sp. Leaf20]